MLSITDTATYIRTGQGRECDIGPESHILTAVPVLAV